MSLWAACTEGPVAVTPSSLRRPPEVMEAFREVCQAALPMAAHVGRIALRSSAFDQGTAGRHVASCRDAALATPFPTGVCRWRQPQGTHELAGGLNTGQIAPCGYEGAGYGARHTTPGLEGLDQLGQTPSFHLLVACLCQTLKAFGVFGDGPDVVLEDHLEKPPRPRMLSRQRRPPATLDAHPCRPTAC